MKMCTVSKLLLVIILLLTMILLVPSESRSLFKQWLIHVDATVLNGFLRRYYLHKKLPCTPITSIAQHATEDYSWIGDESFLPIAHGLGPKLYGGDNAIKTLIKGRERGFRIFEVDISMTSDNVLVCWHGGEEQAINMTSYSDYLAICKSNKQAPCSFDDIVNYAYSNPEVYFVLDVKNRFYDSYSKIRKAVAEQKLGKSFIPQVYDFDQLQYIRKGGLFAGEIFTSYLSFLTTRQIFDFAKKYDVKAVTLTMERFWESVGNFPSDTAILTHPVNDPFIAAGIKKSGAKGIYTSYITPQSIPELF